MNSHSVIPKQVCLTKTLRVTRGFPLPKGAVLEVCDPEQLEAEYGRLLPGQLWVRYGTGQSILDRDEYEAI